MFVQTRPANPEERELLALFRRLPSPQRETLLAFARFLVEREAGVPEEGGAVPAPEPIPRPEEESVVKAIKRLTNTYPMLDRSRVLGETSELVSQHVLQGREAKAVIDELEAVFRRHYERLLADKGDGS